MRSLICVLGIALLSIAHIGRVNGAQPTPPAPPAAETIPPGSEAQPQPTLVVAEPLGSVAEVVVPDLIKLLEDPRWEMRSWAADQLGKLGSEAKAAVPALSG